MTIRAGLQAFAVGVVLVCGAVKAEAAVLTFGALLSGPAEDPPNASPGTGQGTVLIDTVLNTMQVNATFEDLVAPSTVAHIHCCTAVPFVGTAIPATIVPSFPGFPVGITSGSYSNIFNLTLASTFNPAFIAAQGGTVAAAMAALLSGLQEGSAYLNIHSTAFPNGEIRGFLSPVPIPGALSMFASVLGIGGWLGWRKKRSRKLPAGNLT
jgi:hypothetical protein